MPTLSCGHHLPASWFSTQFGIKVTSITIHVCSYRWQDRLCPSSRFNAKLHFTTPPSKIHLVYLWSQPCFLVDYINVSDFLPEETFWNCKMNLHINIPSFETNTSVQRSPLLLTVRRTLLICTNDCNPGWIA